MVTGGLSNPSHSTPRPAFAVAATGAVLLLATACGAGSSPASPGSLPVELPAQPANSTATDNPTEAPTAPCQHPASDITDGLSNRLTGDVEVDRLALLETKSKLGGAPVWFIAGIASRNGARIGAAVWASNAPSRSDSWSGVNVTAQQVSAVRSADGTPASLIHNAVAYSHALACATLGY